MAKMKRCPICNELVSPLLLECPACGEGSLLNAPLEDHNVPPPSEEETPSPAPLIRRCDCGHFNPSQARKCETCGEDISDVAPSPQSPETAVPFTVAANPSARLVSLDGLCEITVLADTPVTLGRSCTDYLRSRLYVSREHALLSISEGKLMLKSVAQTNPTFVNNVAMYYSEERSLQNGDEVGLGGYSLSDGSHQTEAAYFRVEEGG